MNYPDNIEEIRKFAEEIEIDVKYLLGEKWEGSLWLDSVQSFPENIIFNIGGNLWLSCVQSLPSNTIFNVNRKIYFPTDHKVKVIWN